MGVFPPVCCANTKLGLPNSLLKTIDKLGLHDMGQEFLKIGALESVLCTAPEVNPSAAGD